MRGRRHRIGLGCGDIRVAAESAKFRAGDVYLGDYSDVERRHGAQLVHYIGRNRTLDTLLLGEDITAREALDLGIEP